MRLRRRTGQTCRGRGFTLTELLVVMGIIAVLGAITVIAIRAISKDAKLASATNAVKASLDNARGLAIKNNKVVLVAFRAKLLEDSEQVIEVVTAEFSGESFQLNFGFSAIADRFVPIADVPRRELPAGIKIASPHYGGDQDLLWVTGSDLPAIRLANEMAGCVIGVMYGPDGTTLTDNPRTDSIRIYVDFDQDGLQDQGGGAYDNLNNFPDNVAYCDLGDDGYGSALTGYFCQAQNDDEPYVTFAPFVAVFNDAEAREDPRVDPTTWSDGQTRVDEQSLYISDYADRIHFNRYSGVAMR